MVIAVEAVEVDARLCGDEVADLHGPGGDGKPSRGCHPGCRPWCAVVSGDDRPEDHGHLPQMTKAPASAEASWLKAWF
jgi:hypothetical protein